MKDKKKYQSCIFYLAFIKHWDEETMGKAENEISCKKSVTSQ